LLRKTTAATKAIPTQQIANPINPIVLAAIAVKGIAAPKMMARNAIRTPWDMGLDVGSDGRTGGYCGAYGEMLLGGAGMGFMLG